MIDDDVRPMLAEFLAALGFDAMARDVTTETEWSRLQHYARIVLREARPELREDVRARFALLRLV